MRLEQIRVGEAQVVEEGDGRRLTFPVTQGQTQTPVWFKVRNADAAPSGNAALAIALVPAMRTARSLVLADSLSPKLFRSQEVIQRRFQDWDNRFNVVRITAPLGAPHQASAGRTGLFFSAGVDSFFSLLRHREEITHLIVLRGFNIKQKQVVDDLALPSIRVVAAQMNKTLVEVSTNIREFSDRIVDWGLDYHGAALAAVALLLAPTLNKVYVASTHSETDTFRWGSHQFLDPLYSTETLSLIHDGANATRVEKVAAIAENRLVQQTLRVCNKPGASNCGRCEKCLRTMINLRVAGALEKVVTFDRNLRFNEVRLMRVRDENKASFVSENLTALRAKGVDDDLALALNEALSRRYDKGWGRLEKRLIRGMNRFADWLPSRGASSSRG
ncbi:MAG TPA: hypothetical protein VFG04_13435 [Planctomycetaceae bacterium]|jgi:hypothetical protein|nr:hypothetical protein [Planctomycetaceae bacterium]